MPLAKRRRVSVRRRNVRLCRQNGIWDEAGRIPTGASDVLDRALTGLLFHPLWNRKILWLKHKRHSEQTSKLIVPSLSLEDFSRVFLLFYHLHIVFQGQKAAISNTLMFSYLLWCLPWQGYLFFGHTGIPFLEVYDVSVSVSSLPPSSAIPCYVKRLIINCSKGGGIIANSTVTGKSTIKVCNHPMISTLPMIPSTNSHEKPLIGSIGQDHPHAMKQALSKKSSFFASFSCCTMSVPGVN